MTKFRFFIVVVLSYIIVQLFFLYGPNGTYRRSLQEIVLFASSDAGKKATPPPPPPKLPLPSPLPSPSPSPSPPASSSFHPNSKKYYLFQTKDQVENVAQRLNYNQTCKSLTLHGNAFTKRIEPSFLWTMIREPAKRCISNFFFGEVGRKGTKATSENMIEYLKRWKNYELYYLIHGIRQMPMSFNNFLGIKNTTAEEQNAMGMIQNSVMNSYNFVGLVERMDESLVVLKMLMNLKDEDIIVMPSKESGGYTDGIVLNKCKFIQKSFTTPQVDAYIEKEFKNENTNADYLLYDVINHSLDLTIESLGRELVQEGVRKHRELKEIANKYCASKAIFPCSSTGVKQPQYKSSCLWRDAACGYQCVADVLERYKNGELEEES